MARARLVLHCGKVVASALLWMTLCAGGGCRRREIAADSGASGAAITSVAPPALPFEPPELSLIYSADLRGRLRSVGGPQGLGGLARRATIVDRARMSSGALVQVDAGDFLPSAADDSAEDGGANLEQRMHFVLAAYERMGVDAVTIGERELALGPERLGALLRAAGITAVVANLVGKTGEPPFPRDQLIDAGGRSIGVFGIFEPTPKSADDLRRWSLTVTDPVEQTRSAANSLRARGARLVVGLFHVAGGIRRVQEILAQSPGVDVAVLGHASAAEETARPVSGPTQVLSAGLVGERIGRLDVRFAANGAQPGFLDQVLPLTDTIPDQLGVGLLDQTDDVRFRILQDKAAAALRRKRGEKEPDWVFEHWDYASNSACALCHQAAFEFWKKTEHAQAFATLKKSHRDEDPACLGCHSTGYLQPGGTRVLDTLVKNFVDVGCETCHGPSVAHVTSIDKKAKSGTSRTVDPTVCLGCHTPDQSLDPFNYAVALKAVVGPGHGGGTDSGSAETAR
jgi:Cytochrome c554 and c-prime